jgi:hypothetical protein
MGQAGKDSETFGNVMVIRCFCSLRAIFYIGKIKHAQTDLPARVFETEYNQA